MNKLVLIFFLIGIISCQKDPQEVNDEELITTLIYKLKSTSGNDEVVMTFSDPDGNGGNAPVKTTSGFLQAGKMYIGSLT
ncbi:MAG TPA: type 1 periplasmic binding fold superfamily protein, partial [Saprospiraceae bacterium]|nr:type 1 periplasmic binding fold superfamily protein [Saprospiraceae bacterium]